MNNKTYNVEEGHKLSSCWTREIQKHLRKTKHTWEEYKTGLLKEYSQINLLIGKSNKYNILSCSNCGNYLLVKHEVNLLVEKSASKGGFRAGLFVEKNNKVIILFLGHHKHYKKMKLGKDKNCFITMLKTFYPCLYKKIYPH